jgi:hypothetical protein
MFNVLIIDDPCKMSTLTLPLLTAVTITSLSGLTVPQAFYPATDSYEDSITNPGFCGARVYTIVEVPFRNFVTIVSPAPSNVYTTNWTANFKSLSLADVGVWTVTMSVSLSVYPTVTATTTQFTVTVLHICNTTVIQS